MIESKYYEIGNKDITIALITDLHFDSQYNLSLLDKIIDNLKINNPSFICLSGDIIDYSSMIYKKEIKYLEEFINNLKDIAPLIINLGNHDITDYYMSPKDKEIEEWFKKFNTLENVYFLNNKSLVRNDICFTSYNPSFDYYKNEKNMDFVNGIDQKIKLNKKYYNILLCHSPVNTIKDTTLKNSREIKKANLILSGHMHNGLIFKTFDKFGHTGLISPTKRPFPKYARGLIKKHVDDREIILIISGGIIKLSRRTSKFFSHFNGLFQSQIVYIKI